MGNPRETSQAPEKGEEMDRRGFIVKGVRWFTGVVVGGSVLSAWGGCGEPEKPQADSQPPKPDIGVKADGKIPDLTPQPDGKFPDMGRRDGMYEPDRGVDLTRLDKGTDQTMSDTQKPDSLKPDLVDSTPPPAPVITKGSVWIITTSSETIKGTCDAGDTSKIQVKDHLTDPSVKGKSTIPPWVDITYTLGTGKWALPITLNPDEPHWFEFQAVDKANNASTTTSTIAVIYAK